MIEITRQAIRLWITEVATGEFSYKSVLGLTGRLSTENDAKLRKIIFELSHGPNPICESVGRRDGYYRPIEEMPEQENWQDIDTSQDSPIVLPFGLRDWVWIDDGTSIVIAGSKDSGKTGIIMRIVAMNMHRMNVVFITNMENGLAGVKRRFDAMDIEIPNPAPFQVYHKLEDFHQWMKWPDTLYCIDYIDVPDSGEFFMIAPALARIQAKLVGKSVAVVGLQKKTSSDLAYGGEQTLKKAALYLAMNPGKIKIVSAKIPAKPTIIPKNMQWSFKYDDEGTRFTDIVPDYGEQ